MERGAWIGGKVGIMKATICDFCRKPIETAGEHQIVIDKGEPLDVCGDCFTGSVILSECRRSRTRRKAAPKPRRRKAKEDAPANPTG